MDLPTYSLKSLFAPLMFAGLHSHSPLLSILKGLKQKKEGDGLRITFLQNSWFDFVSVLLNNQTFFQDYWLLLLQILSF